MIRHFSLNRAVGTLAAALLALAAGACVRPGGLRPDLDGIPGRATRPSVEAPPAHTSVYKHTPTLEWSALAVGAPSSPGASLFARTWGDPCRPVAAGLARVLPVAGGLPARSLQRIGPVGIGVAGLPIGGGPLAVPSGSALADAMLERTSEMGTSGRNCRPRLFAYLRLGLGADLRPVSVFR